MSNDNIIQISAEASGVERGVRQAENSLNHLAHTAEKTGSKAANSLNQVGDAATRSAKNQERASRSIERALQREIALLQAGERGSRAYYESLAQQRGADVSRLTPMLNQLDTLRQRTDGLTISQGQYNNALRMMPAQMTDIVTQLAGGQNPFLIAIQQGGQMRDSFGGFGNMLKGIAASISPFKLAMGGAVGAIGAVGYAMYSGAQEAREFENVLTLSGNRAGLTAERLQVLSDSVGNSTRNWGAARETVLAFAKTGQIAESDYEQFSRAVTYYSQATGADVSDLVAQFTKIGEDPVKAVVELSKQYRSMTADVYAQVSALVEQGRETEAVRLIQEKMAQEMETNGKKVVENLGYIEQAWRGVKNAVSEAWEAMKGWGRDQTIIEQIATKKAELAQLESQSLSSRGAFGFGLPDEALKAKKARLQAEIEELQKRKDSADIQAAYQQQQAETQQKTIAAQNAIAKAYEKTQSKTQKLVEENKKLAEQLALVEKAGDKVAAKKAREAIAHNKREMANIAERERKAAEREEKASTRRVHRNAWRTTSDGLRLKAGAESAGKSHAGTYAMAHALQSMLGTNLVRFGAFRDKSHVGKNSAHNWGLAFDATPNAKMTRAQMAAVPEKIKAYLANLGFSEKDFFVQFEHAGKRNKNGTVSTGNHWHFNWRNQAAAARFANINDGSAKAFAKKGLYKEFEPSKTEKPSDYEKTIAQLEKKQALLGKNTELARLQYETESGSLKQLSEAEKATLLTLQQTIDAKTKQYETDQKYSSLIDELAQKTRQQFDNKAFELSLLGQSKQEIEKLTLARQYDQYIMQATADGANAEYIDGLKQQKVAAEEARLELEKIKAASANDWLAGVKDGVVEYIDDFKTMRQSVGNLVSQTAHGFTDQIAEFVATGKANFREFTQSVIADISKMMIKMAIFNAIKAGANAMSGSGGWVGAIGSAISGAFSEGGYTGHGGKYEPAGIVHKGEYVLSQENLRALGGVQAVENLLHRAKGYSSGGLVGEGLVGGGLGLHGKSQAASAPVINIVVNVSGSENTKQDAQKGVEAAIPQLVASLVKAQIAEETRYGGMIYQVAKG